MSYIYLIDVFVLMNDVLELEEVIEQTRRFVSKVQNETFNGDTFQDKSQVGTSSVGVGHCYTYHSTDLRLRRIFRWSCSTP